VKLDRPSPGDCPTWWRLENEDDVPSPALLFYADRIERNLDQMLTVAGGAHRLRPHAKTHKCRRLVQRQMARGIRKFKCATVAEAELLATAGVGDVLLAYQPVGPNLARLLDLVARHPQTRWSCLVDDPGALRTLADAAARRAVRLEVLLDLDVGQHRTGIAPGDGAAQLYRAIAASRALTPGGLHAYDGHIVETDPAARAAACEMAFAPVEALRRALVAEGLPVPRVVAGGSPTFPLHARRSEVECSPGTCLLWDAGYASKLPDLDFLPAAALLTRVVSRHSPGRLCLDLGHKAVASEMPPPRAVLLNLAGAQAVLHSEEHLVVESPEAARFAVGDCLYALPWHICPTVALHEEAFVVEHGRVTERWPIEARARRLSV
jgi:D-serine deaminase-like pyridoxal phosphate-dependent protein